jgi:hypothetical protein
VTVMAIPLGLCCHSTDGKHVTAPGLVLGLMHNFKVRLYSRRWIVLFLVYTGCFKKSLTTSRANINLFRGHVQCFHPS